MYCSEFYVIYIKTKLLYIIHVYHKFYWSDDEDDDNIGIILTFSM